MTPLLPSYSVVVCKVFPHPGYENCENTAEQKWKVGFYTIFRWTMTEIKKGGCVPLEQLIYEHSLLQLFPKTEVIIIRQLKDLNWRCCSEKHHLIKCHIDLDWSEFCMWMYCWCSPGPSRYWDVENCRRITTGSDRLILQAWAATSCGHQKDFNAFRCHPNISL